jgi:hypothetical protein
VVKIVSSLRGFDHLLGAEAPRADADAFDTAVDDRPNRLEVRLEPPRADIMRMANLPAHHGTLSANLTPLGHIQYTVAFTKRKPPL